MVLDTEPKIYADWKLIELLRRRKREGTLGRLELTQPLWLRKEIAAELGFNAGEEDFLLEPRPVQGKAVFGKIPIPGIIPEPIATTPSFVPTKKPTRPLPQPLPATPPITLSGDYGRLYQEYQRTGGTLDVIDWGAAGAPLRPDIETEPTEEGLQKFLNELGQAGQVSDVENILRAAQLPEEEIDQVVGVETRQQELETLANRVFPQYDLEGLARLFEEDQEAFFERIQQGGYTSDKENLLRLIGFSPEDIDTIIPPWWTLEYWKQAFFKPYGGKDIKGKLAASFVAGIGNTIKTTGGAARWLGWEDAGNVLTTIGATLGQVAPPDVSAEFNWEDTFMGVARAIPFSLGLLPVTLGGYSVGAATATALGVGRIGSAIIGGLGGAALSRPLESAMEAGGAYDDAIARGKPEAVAKKEADEIFKKNMTLAGADAFEIAIALAPTPKWVPSSLVKAGLVRTARVSGKMVIVGLSEGGEELYQDMITRHARGEEWQLDPVSKEVFAIGAVMGLGGGLGGDVLSGVVDRAKTRMSDSLRKQFNAQVASFRAEGFTAEQAELRALDAIAETPEGEKVVSEAIKEVAPQPGQIAPEVKPAVVEKPLVKEAVPEKVTPAPEGIPFMITRQQETQLRGLGYTQGDINKMTPQQAQAILTKQPAPEEVTPAPEVTETEEARLTRLQTERAKAIPSDAEMLEYNKKWLAIKQVEYKRARGNRREAIGREIRDYERSIKTLEAKIAIPEAEVTPAPEVTTPELKTGAYIYSYIAEDGGKRKGRDTGKYIGTLQKLQSEGEITNLDYEAVSETNAKRWFQSSATFNIDTFAKQAKFTRKVTPTPPAVTPAPEVTKEPWQMTRAEWIAEGRGNPEIHKLIVKERLAQQTPRTRKVVPAEVLKDYPDLAKVTPTAPAVTPLERVEMNFSQGKVQAALIALKQGGFGSISALPTGTGRYFAWIPNTSEAIAIARKHGGTISTKQPEFLQVVPPATPAVEIPKPVITPQRQKPLPKKYADLIKKESPDPKTAREDIAKARKAYNEGDIMMLEDMDLDELARELEQKVIKTELKRLEVREISLPIEPAKVEITTPTGERIPSAYTEAPSPTEGATARVFSRIQTEPAESNFKEKVKQGWHKFNIKMVDDLDPIRRITEEIKKGGVELSIDENPYLLARLLRGVTSKATTFLEYGTFGKNFHKVDKQGRASPNYTGESLQNILNEVKDPVKWRDFSTYLTARRSVELSARAIETGIEVNDARASIAELEAKYPEFKGLAPRVYKYQDSLLVYAQEMGLLSQDMLGRLRKYGNYVPFYRVFNELQAKGLFGKKMANVASPIKRIKGSEREIINPLESIVKNTYVLVNAADRNQVGIAIANLVDKNPELADVFERVKTPIARVAQVSAKELGVEVEGLTEAEEEQMVDIFRPSFFVRGDEVTVLIDGKKNYYRVDADLRDSLLRLDRESLGLLGKWLGAPARWLRAGATLSPDFMFRNPARDQLTAFAYSNYGFMPGIDFVRGLASMLRKDADYQLFRMSGAEHSMLVSMDRSYLQKTFKQIVEGKGFTEYVKHPMELFRIVSELGEKATRLGEFKKGIQSGAVPLEAGYSARSVTLDFAQAGTTAQAINTFIAFFNANIRGWGRMISSFKEQPIRTSAKVFLGITLPSILLWAVNHDDDRWKEIPQWQKDLFWIVFVGDNIYRIPKPFELGILFGSFPERFLDWLVDKDPDLMKDLAQSLIEAGSPGFIPTAGLPILEWITNYSFFRGRAIVPKSRQAMPPELQYTPWTSEVSKKLGELLKLPPAHIDNLLFAWTGGLGRYATDILDGALKGTGISPDIPEPSPTLADIPVIKAFVVRNPYGSSSEAVNDFYNFLEKYEGGEKYLKEMLINGELEKYNNYKAAHPELFFFADFDSERYAEAITKGETPKDVFYSSSARYLRRVASQLSEIGKKEDLIYKDKDMTSEKKRELIDELEILKTDIARKAVDLLQMKEPTILQDMITETVNRLGEVIEEATPLSLEKPDIFTIPDAYREFDSILAGATIKDLEGLKGIDPLALAYLKKEEIEKTLEPILNKQIKDIDFNLKEGVPFEDYYKQWQLGLVKDSPLDKISRRQVELLRKYEASDDKKAFLRSLSDDEKVLLNENPQKEWFKSRPTENAEWALAGKVSLLTKEAYNQFKSMVKELDIPDTAIPEQTLPPEGSIDAYFERNDIVDEFGAGSWEDQLLRAKNSELNEWLKLADIDTPIASLELKTIPLYHETWNKLKKEDDPDWVGNLDDKIKDKDGLTERDRAIAELKATKIGDMTWVDIDRKVEAIEKGTDEAPVPDAIVNAYIDRGRLIDKEGIGASSAEVMLQRVDNPDFDKWLTDEEIWGDKALEPIDRSKIPIWRIDVKYSKEDAEYQAILDRYDETKIRQQTAAIDRYLADKEPYRKDRRRREAYQKGLTAQVENYVSYNELPEKGDWRERFRRDNPGFDKAMTAYQKANNLPIWADLELDKIRPQIYDDLYDRFQGQFDTYDNVQGTEKERRTARKVMLDEDTTFRDAFYRRAAYEKYIPEVYTNAEAPGNPIDDYVAYSLIEKPDDYPEDLSYYEDDWWMMEHPEFYQEVYLKVLGNQRKDYRKVPSREVWAKYQHYDSLKFRADQDKYRLDNPDLDEWGVLKGIWTETMTAKRQRMSISQAERISAEIEERLRKLKETVGSR